jgi:hypothetical protein
LNVEIVPAPQVPVLPEQRVILDLSVEEFAMLEHLRFKYLAGDSSLRTNLDDGFAIARAGLAQGWHKKVAEARGYKHAADNNSQFVQGIFAE